MQTCNNCGDCFDDTKNGLVTSEAGRMIAAVCGRCCQGVCVGKIVIRRQTPSRFTYEQWLPTEMFGDVP